MDPGREIHDAVDEGYVDVDLGDLSHTIFSRSDEKNESRRSASSGGWVQNQSVKNLVPEKNDNDERTKETMPLDRAGLFSFITYSWLTKYMKRAYKQGLKRDDIPLCSTKDSCENAAQRLGRMWNEEVKRHGLEDASLKRVTWKFVRSRVLVNIILYLTSIVFGFIGPIFFMRRLVQFVQDNDKVWWHGAILAAGMAGSELMRVLLFGMSWAIAYRTGSRLRSAVMALLYKKVIRLSTLGDKSIGEMINLFANDGQRIYEVASFGPFIVGDPFVAAIGTGYTIWLLGPHAALGMLVFVLFYPVQYLVSRLTGYFRRQTLKATDQRVQLMNELLICMKLIKMYAWEKPFAKSIKNIREKEKKYLEATAYVQSASVALTPVVPIIAVIVTFLAHIGFGYDLSPAEGFAVVAVMISRVRPSLNGAREALKTWDEARVIWPRIKSVLSMEEIQPFSEKPIDRSIALAIYNGTFVWHTAAKKAKANKMSFWDRICCCCRHHDPEKEVLTTAIPPKPIPVLISINLIVPKGRLVGVCGTVGSSKSSLISAILGQMILAQGRVTIDGSFAYVSQQAWIINCTLRDNILFGETFDVERYNRVLTVCALDQDIGILPAGDQTEIGERGINLSGGQRQRVAMARAIYANRDIYLLDDPLSSVDSHVGNHIFNYCIRGALKDKTVIFVTHQLQYLSQCDEVIFMDRGRILDQGRHVDLMKQNERYGSLIHAFLHDENEKNLIEIDVDDGHIIPENHPSQISPETATRKRKQFATKRDSSATSKESVLANHSIDDELCPSVDITVDTGGRLVQDEKVEVGSIPMETYNTYIKAAGGYLLAIFVFSMFVINVVGTAMSSWWLAHWLDVGVVNASRIVDNQTEYYPSVRGHPDLHYYELVYGLFILVIVLSSLMRSFFFIKASLRASNLLHNRLLVKVFNSPMSFFDSTPVGRILNIFSRDLDETDCRLPSCNEALTQNMLVVTMSMVFIAMVVPWFLIALLLLAIFFVLISRVFRCALRDLKRLENVSRSPIYSHVTASISGLNTIHAFGKEREFVSKFMDLFDENSSTFFLFTCSMRWLAVRLDFIAVCIMGITGGLVVGLRGMIPPAFAGLALAYAGQLTGILQNTVRWASETESRFTSVQRMQTSLQTLESEGPAVIQERRPPKDWPQRGSILFSNVKMRYRPNLPLVLNNVSFHIRPKEKIGIVGRTGSGKSSLGVALFRLVDLASGLIEIDGINISEIGLEDLRSKLSIIPQDPVLFIGTVRYNLDPFQKYDDDVIWEAIERTNMKEKIKALPGQLDSAVIENGENFSVGERQLLCMARALLRHSKILLLDEATAAIDTQTDTLVQKTLREAFEDCTILTIAHRLNTVIECDRVLVLRDGVVVEFDNPLVLLGDYRSSFAGMMAAAQDRNHLSV
ncbi:ATP-binding cassette sub-family C member 5-like [Daphnia pulicaria]|uniref:ATP-binding cassette sub-family C member 5-like n=1 Tax=Daphnia pulicaria TaxID=35523 RepID=UPI001EEBA8D8|nr:ATP-binding cassette sub-family C member 5-like [Daphnia pulicaria]